MGEEPRRIVQSWILRLRPFASLRVRAAVQKGLALSSALLAAANELDNFVAVAGLDDGFLPVGTGENFKIAFDGDAAGIEAQFTKQIGHRGARTGGALLSVDRDGYHRHPSFSSRQGRAAWHATGNANVPEC